MSFFRQHKEGEPDQFSASSQPLGEGWIVAPVVAAIKEQPPNPTSYVRLDTGAEIVLSGSAQGYEGDGQVAARLPEPFEIWDGDGWVLDSTAADLFLHDKVDQAAGEFCKLFITVAPGQGERYMQKRMAAERCLAGAHAETFAMLESEAAARNMTVLELATMVKAIADQWELLGGRIEGARIAAKIAITAAPTWAEKQAAADVDWSALLAP